MFIDVHYENLNAVYSIVFSHVLISSWVEIQVATVWCRALRRAKKWRALLKIVRLCFP